jgi:hypothetical protein
MRPVFSGNDVDAELIDLACENLERLGGWPPTARQHDAVNPLVSTSGSSHSS